MFPPLERGAKVLGAYYDQRPFSVDLIGAVRASLGAVLGLWSGTFHLQVLRQGSFVKKIYDLGWTSSRYFEKHEDAAILHHAVVRYHAWGILCPIPQTFLPLASRFLDLIASSQHILVVPTLDIDLVWHSHQLSGPRYHKDCRTNVGRYVDQ